MRPRSRAARTYAGGHGPRRSYFIGLSLIYLLNYYKKLIFQSSTAKPDNSKVVFYF